MLSRPTDTTRCWKRNSLLSYNQSAVAGSGIEVLGARFRKRDDGAVSRSRVVEDLLASIRVVTGEDDDVEIVRDAVMVGKGVSIAVS